LLQKSGPYIVLKPVVFLAGVCIAAAYFAPDMAARLVDRPSNSTNSRPVANIVSAPANLNYGGHFHVPADRSGHYLTEAQVNGRPLNFMVDTGASLVILRYEDARMLGVIYGSDQFEVSVQTANGIARAHRVKINSMRLGSISFDDVDALVLEQGVLKTNLLGMSFLRRLSRYEVRGDTLILER
jgi:aspartyl protease family protein